MASSISSCIVTPRNARLTAPVSASWSATQRASLAGTARPMPSYPPPRDVIAVLMPTISPSRFTSGPPELPGLMAASCCK